jgi:hypothetical protein
MRRCVVVWILLCVGLVLLVRHPQQREGMTAGTLVMPLPPIADSGQAAP